MTNREMCATAICLALAGTLAASGDAHANAAQRSWSVPSNGYVGPLVSPTPVAVLHETLHIDCTRGEPCAFEAVYAIENPSDAALDVKGAFYTYKPAPIDITLDGADVRLALEADDAAKLLNDARAAASGSDSRHAEPWTGAVASQGFGFRIEAHHRARLVFRGPLKTVLQSTDELSDGYAMPAAQARHLVFFTPTDGSVRRYDYPIAPLRTWGGHPTVDVTIVLPDRGDVDVDLDPDWDLLAHESRKNGTRTVMATIDPAKLEDLSFTLKDPVRHEPFIAGPVVGLGARLDRQELLLRAGIEATKPAGWAIYSLNVDSNLKDYVVASAVAEAATPAIFVVFPSLAAGLGVPVRVEKGGPTRVGVRGQLSITAPAVGFVLPIDVYPAAGQHGDHVAVSLLARVSF